MEHLWNLMNSHSVRIYLNPNSLYPVELCINMGMALFGFAF